MKYLLNNDGFNNDGKVRNCSSNIAKMRWYAYGWYIGREQVKYWYRDYFVEIVRVLKSLFTLFIATLLIPFTPLIYPFVWSSRIRKAKKEVKEWKQSSTEEK